MAFNITIDGKQAHIKNKDVISFRSNFANVDDFTGEIQTMEIGVDSLILVNESYTQLMTHIQTKGLGIGIPVTVSYGGIELKYVLNLTKNLRINERSQTANVTIEKRGGNLSFFERSNSLSFALLAKKGVTFNTINIPFVVIPRDRVSQAMTAILALYNAEIAFIQAAKELQETIGDTLNLVNINPIEIAAASIKIAAKTAFITLQLLLILSLSKKIIRLIFPKIRNMKACTVNELLTKACAYMGYSFKSDLLDELPGLAILPVPLAKGKKKLWQFFDEDLQDSFTYGYPTGQDTVAIVGQLFSELKTAFNGKTDVTDNVVRFERRDNYKYQTPVELVPGVSNQEEHDDSYEYNTNDLWVRQYIHYLTDQADVNTLDNFDPTDQEMGAQNVLSAPPDLDMLKGLQDKQINLALGTRKEEYTAVENLLLEAFKVMDKIAGTNSAAIISKRKGVLVLSDDFYDVTKLLYIENGKQPENYLDYIGAPQLQAKYHTIDQIENNSFTIHTGIPFAITEQQFVQTISSRLMNINGVQCQIIDIQHIPDSGRATIDYRKPSDWAKNKISTFTVN